MAYLIICQDSDRAATLRKTHLQAHLDYIDGIVDKVGVAGPTASELSNGWDGSCFIYQTAEQYEAETLFYNDPYYINGVYRKFRFLDFYPGLAARIGSNIGCL